MAFRLLALAASDRSKAEIIIAYPVCNIMEERSSVIVCSVNIGNLINTRREVLEGCTVVINLERKLQIFCEDDYCNKEKLHKE